MTIAAVLVSKGSHVATIGPDDPVSAAIDLLTQHRIGALPVVEEGAIVGILSERDIIYCLKEAGGTVLEWTVRRMMTAPAVTVEPATPVLAALSLMTRRRIRHLPVVENGAIRGIVSIGDLVKYRMERIEAEADAMRAYIQGS